MVQDPVVIVSAARTPMGSMLGDFTPMSAHDLGRYAIEAAMKRSGLSAESIDEVIMGNVLMAGQGQAPARQAALAAGIAHTTPATTINKMCGSGLKAVMMAHDQILSGSADVVVAGGMESMTNAPYLLPNARAGMRFGHGAVQDSMLLDGLEDAYEKGTPMGVYADRTAEKYQFTREMQDAFALESLKRARGAIESGAFKQEIVPVDVIGRKGTVTIATDEQPGRAMPEKIPSLKPAFTKDGTVTAATSSSISDGAAALVLMRASEAQKRGMKPLAKIISHASNAHEPAWFTTAPVGAIEKALEKAGWDAKDVDLYEINEAFAVVTMAAMRDLNLPHEKVNVHGGACALGHPIGASGARILTTLLYALETYGKTRGVASLCIGGGEAVAVAVERINN